MTTIEVNHYIHPGDGRSVHQAYYATAPHIKFHAPDMTTAVGRLVCENPPEGIVILRNDTRLTAERAS